MKSEYDIVYLFYDPLLSLPLRPVRRSVARSLSDRKDGSILDLCCGTGDQLRYLARAGFKDLHGLDISSSMLKVARRKKGAAISYSNGDATRMGFEDGSFDVITISLAFHEIDRTTGSGILREAFRVLRDDGELLIADYEYDGSTNSFAKVVITLIERFAGKRHYGLFRDFLERGGLSTIDGMEQFELVAKDRELYNSVTIYTFRKRIIDV